MNTKKFSDAMSELDPKYVYEALNYKKKAKKPIFVKWRAIVACLCLMIPLTACAIDIIQYNAALDTPTQVTSEQIKKLTPTMTRKDVLSLLGDTEDIGSGIYIYLYEVDQQYLLRIPFASDEAQLGVTGEDLLKALVPISGDLAPMVYVNDTLYQVVDP